MRLICDKCHSVFESESLACPKRGCGGAGSGYVNAVGARNIAHVSDMFAEIEKHDVMVGRVVLPHSLGKSLSEKGLIDGRRLWSATIEVLEEDLLPVWDEEPVRKKRSKHGKARTNRAR